ncbi:MAG: ROK family protein [bacterium]
MYLVFDIGGSKTRLAISKDGKTLGEVKVIPTAQNFDIAIVELQQAVMELTGGEDIKRVAGGIAGSLSADKSTIHRAPHLPGWVGKKIKSSLEGVFGCDVLIENDASMGALGEATYGAGKDEKIVVYLTVSTGVGGARIVNGKIDQSALGFEPGHHYIDGNNTLEDLISGTAVEAKYGCKPKEINDSTVWDDLAHKLAIGLYNVSTFWSPNMIVVGGSMMNEIGIPINNATEYMRALPEVQLAWPKIQHAQLGDSCGLYGALARLQQEL